MNTEVIDATPTNALAVAIRETGIDQNGAKSLLEAFQPFFNAAMNLVSAANGIKVSGPTDAEGMHAAREHRIALMKVRTGAERKRVEIKDEALRMCKSIDKVASVIPMLTESVEKSLMDLEKTAERAEAERKAKRRAEREVQLRPYSVNTTLFKLEEMTDAEFSELLDGTRAAHEAKIAAAKKAEEERRSAEAARAEEESRLRIENERLRKEREAAEQVARAERAERERLERERADVERRERAKKDAEAKAKRAAARAPDADKLRALASALLAIPIPSMSSDDGHEAAAQAGEHIANAAKSIRDIAASLS